MAIPLALPQIDPAQLQRLDDEFVAQLAAGTLPSLNLPPLDPATDPFGMDYAWLNPPNHPYDAAFEEFQGHTLTALYHVGGDELRRIVAGGSQSLDHDNNLYRAWVREGFTEMCRSAGEDGAELVELLQFEEGGIACEVAFEVACLLEVQSSFANLTSELRMIAALIVMKILKPNPFLASSGVLVERWHE